MPANQNQLLPSNHGDAYALSSDEEMFQECESTFDSLNVAATAANKSVLSEIELNNSVANNAAHSTNYGAADDVANTTGTFQLAMEDGDISIISNELQKSIAEQSQSDKTYDEQLHWDKTLEKEPSLTPQKEVQADKTFEESPRSNEIFEEQLQIDRTLEKEAPGEQLLSEQSENNTTLDKEPQTNTTVEELSQADNIPLNLLHGNETTAKESFSEKAVDEQPQGNETVHIEDTAVNTSQQSVDLAKESEVDANTTAPLSHPASANDLTNVLSESISGPRWPLAATEPTSSSPDLANITHVVRTGNLNNVTQVLHTLSTPSSRHINQTFAHSETPIQFNSTDIISPFNINALNETVSIGTKQLDVTHSLDQTVSMPETSVQFNLTDIISSPNINALNEMVSIGADQLDMTHSLKAQSSSTKEINQTVTLSQLPPESYDFNATTVINSVDDHSLNDTVDITPPSPKFDVVLETKLDNPIPADVTMDVDPSNELHNCSKSKENVPLNGAMADSVVDENEAILKEEIINKLAASFESETMDIEWNSAVASENVSDNNQDTPNNEEDARRLSIRQDLFDKVRENKNTENAVADCDVFKVPFPPQPFQLGFSNSQFGVTEDDFQSNGSKFFIMLLLVLFY